MYCHISVQPTTLLLLSTKTKSANTEVDANCDFKSRDHVETLKCRNEYLDASHRLLRTLGQPR